MKAKRARRVAVLGILMADVVADRLGELGVPVEALPDAEAALGAVLKVAGRLDKARQAAKGGGRKARAKAGRCEARCMAELAVIAERLAAGVLAAEVENWAAQLKTAPGDQEAA
jgi:hypothetical protein